MKDRNHEKSFWLTEEEAMGLLDIVMLSPAEMTAEQRAAAVKLSDFCRQFLRSSEENNGASHSTIHASASPSVFVA